LAGYTPLNNNKFKITQGWASSYIGVILINQDDSHQSEAQIWIQKAIEEDLRNGDRTMARENMERAIENLKDCDADGWVEKYEKELTTLQLMG